MCILIKNCLNLHCSLQGDKPRFSNLSQSKGKSLVRPKVQKRPHVSSPINNDEFQIKEETKNQIQDDLMLHQNLIMEMEQEAANQEEDILQNITSNMINSAIDLDNDLDL